MYPVTMFRTLTLLFLTLTHKTQSSHVFQSEKRLNGTKVVSGYICVSEDIDNIQEILGNSMNCSSEVSMVQKKDFESSISNRKIDDALETVKKAISEEKQHIRTALNQMGTEIEGIQNAFTDTENRLFKELHVHDIDFKKLQNDVVFQGAQLQKIKEELEMKEKAIDMYQRLNVELEKQITSLRKKLHQEKDNWDFKVKTLEKKLELVATRQCSDSSWTSFGTSCYHVGNDALTWEEAKTKCESYDGILAEVENDSENTFLMELAKQKDTRGKGAWLGASDLETEGLWIWSSSKRQIFDVFSNFKGKEPNGRARENCLHLKKSKWEWNDEKCHNKMGYICERGNI
ncbi:CD209 antigen-like protein B [Mercenaria mercenaria]|uniref:CD209 antigen-like protein B n=1 Tax=Mercenaria mercenaria TaxID=6596 RepID=UPI00234EAAE2|nr:CD209 antigen-like protein B [Mercenaria mercenaria]